MDHTDIAVPRSRSVPMACASIVIAISITPLLSTKYGDHVGLWLLAALSYVAGIAGALMAWRPTRLVLDRQGFYKVGCTRRASNKTMWRDVECFKVMTVPGINGRVRKEVGIKYRTGSYRPGRVSATLNALTNAGVDEYIPMIWPRPTEAIVRELNDYRHRAVSAAA